MADPLVSAAPSTATVPRSADAVVVGAGHNGLVAGIMLADAGWDVVVLEATATPGGAVRSAELTAPGFRSDVFSAFYPFGAASPVLAGLGLADMGLRWRHAPRVLAHVLEDGRAAVLSSGPRRDGGLPGRVRRRGRGRLADAGRRVGAHPRTADRRAVPPVPAGPSGRPAGGAAGHGGPAAAGALRGAAGAPRRRGAVRRRRRRAAARRQRAAHRPDPGGGRQRDLRVAARHAGPDRRLPGAGGRRGRADRRAGPPAAGGRWPAVLRAARHRDHGRAAAGRRASVRPAAPPSRHGGPSSPTSPPHALPGPARRRAPAVPVASRTWRPSSGTPERSRSTGRCRRRRHGSPRRRGAPARCISAPT